jgi:hypothetical protein
MSSTRKAPEDLGPTYSSPEAAAAVTAAATAVEAAEVATAVVTAVEAVEVATAAAGEAVSGFGGAAAAAAAAAAAIGAGETVCGSGALTSHHP